MCAWGMRAGRGELAIFPFLSEFLSSFFRFLIFLLLVVYVCSILQHVAAADDDATMQIWNICFVFSLCAFASRRSLLCCGFAATLDYFYANAFLAFRSFEFLVFEPDANFVIFREVLIFSRAWKVFLGFWDFVWISLSFGIFGNFTQLGKVS